MITLAIPTYRKFDMCQQCVDSALAGSMPPDRVIVVDNSGGQCPPIAGAEIVLGRQPQSVAKAWNDTARLADSDWLIVSNDDVRLAPHTIEYMVALAEATPRAGVVTAIGFALFLWRRQARLKVCEFDEGFKEAYFEDNDMGRRMWLEDWLDVPAGHDGLWHGGSQTIATFRGPEVHAQHESFRANEQRYHAKWGGPPLGERYTVAWNGGPPR